MKLYKMGQVVKMLNMDKNLLNQWYKRKILIPHEPPRRAGCAALYSRENLMQILLVERLGNAGVSLSVAGKIAKEASEVTREVWSDDEVIDIWVCLDLENPKDQVFWGEEPQTIDWDITLSIRINSVYEQVDQRLKTKS